MQWTLHRVDSTPSTNTLALDAAAKDSPEGTVFVADEQTAGRGRGGHDWHSPPGSGIYLSVLLRPRLSASESLWLSLIAGLAVHSAIEIVAGYRCDLRWPNDIMSSCQPPAAGCQKKLGGILTETAIEGERLRHAVVGIGLNVNQRGFPPALEDIATSLRIETGREWDREALIAALLESLSKEYRDLRPGSVVQRFEARSSYARGAQIESESGSLRGATAGLDERGFLRIETGAGVKTIVSGGVRKVES